MNRSSSGQRFTAPQPELFASIIEGILNGDLEWALFVVGVLIAIALELAGVRALPFAVGMYLPISSSTPIFVGGMIRWLVDRKRKGSGDEEFSPGTLLSSGYIAGGTIAAIPAAVVVWRSWEAKCDLGAQLGSFCQSNVSGIAAFALITALLYRAGTKGTSAVSPTISGEAG